MSEKINLPMIMHMEEVYLKHFYCLIAPHSSSTPQKEPSNLIRARFPSLPMSSLSGVRCTANIDSLNKRINFLQILAQEQRSSFTIDVKIFQAWNFQSQYDFK